MHVRASWLLAGVSVLLACGDIHNPVQPSRDVTRGAAAAFVPAAGFTEVQVRGSACALSATSELSCFGGSNGTPAPEAPAQPPAGAYQSFSLGAAHGCALRLDGTIACWGENVGGQLNGIPTEGGFRSLAAGGRHTCAVAADGSIRCWGDNSAGQTIGLPVEKGFTQVVSGHNHSCALAADGSIRCWGQTGGSNAPPPGPGYTLLSAGQHHTCALNLDGAIRCWGDNSQGQLNGIPATNNFARLALGSAHGCALHRAGTIHCWGDGSDNQLSGVPTDDGYFMLTTHWLSTCALRFSDGTVRCWGNDKYGQATQTPTGGGFTQVSTGFFHNCAVGADTRITCWGDVANLRLPGVTIRPTADFSAPNAVPEGTDIALALANTQLPGYSGPAAFEYAFDCDDGSGPTGYTSTPSHTCSTTDDGVRHVVGYVRDQDGDEGVYGAEVVVTNVAPTIDVFRNGGPADEPAPLCPTAFRLFKVVEASDPGDDNLNISMRINGGAWFAPLGGSKIPGDFVAPGNFVVVYCFDGPGPYEVELAVTDGDGGSDSRAFVVTFTNTDPGDDVVVAPVDETTGEPSPVELTFDNVTGGGETTVSSGTVGGGGGPPPPSNFRLGTPPTYYNIETDATFTGSIQICISYAGVTYGNESQLRLLHFEGGAWVNVTSPGYPDTANDIICGTVTSLSPFLVAEANRAPVITSLSVPTTPTPLGGSAQLGGAFTDLNPGDTHSAMIDWGDGVTTPASLTEQNGSGSVSGAHTYASAGVYSVRLTVSDGELTGVRSSADIPAYIVVYDADGAFVTGAGWFTSPTGALASATDVSGKAAFGFVSKYQRGATVPTGTTEFRFTAGDVSFRSASYQWLVVSGNRAQFKGDGRINGSGDYGFLVTAIDGNLDGSGDRFRIKIWNKADGSIVYDNQPGADENGPAATTLGGGNIVIHKGAS